MEVDVEIVVLGQVEDHSLGCLDQLIGRPLDEGDLLSNANTLIHMGKIRDGNKLRRAIYIAKHRGSSASEEIHPFDIGDEGLCIRRLEAVSKPSF